MKCVICRHWELKPGTATVTLERGAAMVVFKTVPAQVCENCGEEYVDDTITARLLAILEQSEAAYSDDSALLFRRKAPGYSEGKRRVIPKDSALPFRLNRTSCCGRIGA